MTVGSSLKSQAPAFHVRYGEGYARLKGHQDCEQAVGGLPGECHPQLSLAPPLTSPSSELRAWREPMLSPRTPRGICHGGQPPAISSTADGLWIRPPDCPRVTWGRTHVQWLLLAHVPQPRPRESPHLAQHVGLAPGLTNPAGEQRDGGGGGGWLPPGRSLSAAPSQVICEAICLRGKLIPGDPRAEGSWGSGVPGKEVSAATPPTSWSHQPR